jgi:hypothetical protein
MIGAYISVGVCILLLIGWLGELIPFIKYILSDNGNTWGE